MYSNITAVVVVNTNRKPDQQQQTGVSSVSSTSSSSSALMLDIGANAGFYGLLAARFGHKVLLFDLQPECQSMIQNAIIANDITNLAQVVAAGVSEEDGIITVSNEGCDMKYPRVKPAGSEQLEVPLHPLTHWVDPQEGGEIMLMKVDTEGNEKRVLKGALPFFKNHKVRNLIIELSPCCSFWLDAGITEAEILDVLAEIVEVHGYVMIGLADFRIFRTRQDMADYFHAIQYRKAWKGGQFDAWLTLDENLLPENITSAVSLDYQHIMAQG